MPLFEFDEGSQVGPLGGTNPSHTFSDESVNFTISTSGNPGGNQLTYSPALGGDGQISISDQGTGVASWTLDVTNAASNFSGLLALRLGSSITGTWQVILNGTNGNFTTTINAANADSTINVNQGGTNEFTSIKFVPSGSAYLTLDNLNATLVCYLEGTGIETARGRVAVEDLLPGDTLPLATGGETTVKWVGVQPINARTAHPAKVNPICIKAGAVADGVPSRDLFVSPDHAVEIDGLLFNASALVNGKTIYKVAQMPMDGFSYYHVETDTHELILAEGLASESYLDNPDRSAFINGAERAGVPMIREMALPRIIAPRMVPVEIVARLAGRADAQMQTTAADEVAA
ncbi:Hint domain-containing protein [Primorskyibacter sp. 2E107]|uniref:Hint domain-containing protein n=1 Tax=Primorskyibacter sp. 2E107 TaxID=3403458 RepID=UPI003AF4A6DD